MVRRRYEAVHTSGIIIFAKEYIQGYRHVVKPWSGHGIAVRHGFYWHSTFGTGCVAASGFILQPNIQEREFARYAPMLDSLDPANVFQYCRALCRVSHDYGVRLPAYE